MIRFQAVFSILSAVGLSLGSAIALDVHVPSRGLAQSVTPPAETPLPSVSPPQTSPAAKPTTDPATQSIRDCFKTYKEALIAREGLTAANQVSQTTLEYYGQMRDLALHGDAKTVQGRSLADQYLVLALRHRVGLIKLQPMTNKAVVSLAVSEGWIGESSLSETELGDLSIQNDRAEAPLVVSGQPYPTGPKFVFLKEQGQWKIDITALLPTAEQFFQQWYDNDNKEAPISKDAFLLKILALVSGKPVPAEIWQPLVKF